MELNHTLKAFALLSNNPKMTAKELAAALGKELDDYGYVYDLKCYFRNSGGTLKGMRLSRKYRGRIPAEAWAAE